MFCTPILAFETIGFRVGGLLIVGTIMILDSQFIADHASKDHFAATISYFATDVSQSVIMKSGLRPPARPLHYAWVVATITFVTLLFTAAIPATSQDRLLGWDGAWRVEHRRCPVTRLHYQSGSAGHSLDHQRINTIGQMTAGSSRSR
jgi:hypothetical protein